MTDRVEETIVVEGVATDVNLDSLRAWPERPAGTPAVHLWANPSDESARRVKVTIEVLAEEPTPQRGDVWEVANGTSRFLLRSETEDDRSLWWGVCVHATNAGRVGDHYKVAPGRLVARLDPVQGDEQ